MSVMMIVICSVLFFFLSVVFIVAWCRIFIKAGYHPGLFFIPVYGVYLCYKIADSAHLFFSTLAISLIIIIVPLLFSPVVCLFLYIIAGIALLFITVNYLHYLSISFGKGNWFTAGLVFLYPVFICILGYGDAFYIGSAGSSGILFHSLSSKHNTASITVPKWINDEFVKCPKCGKTMTVGYVQFRKKCPVCNQVYNA